MKTLKHLFGLLALALVVVFSPGCSDDEDPSPQEQLIGTWKATKIVVTNCGDDNADLTAGSNGEFCESELGLEICFSMTVTITADQATSTTVTKLNGTVLDTANETDSYTATDTEFCVDFDNSGADECYTYTISGNTLTITGTDDDGCGNTITMTKQ